MSAPAPPDLPLQTLNYAATGGPAVDITPAHLSAARQFIVLAVLSQACVVVCLLSLTVMDHTPAVSSIHFCIFAATIACAFYSGLTLLFTGFALQRQLVINLPPLVALAILAVVPYLFQWTIGTSSGSAPVTMQWVLCVLLTLAFGTLSVFSFRHVALYRYLASWLNQTRRGLHNELRALGMFKAFFETCWLACCSACCLAPVAPAAESLFLLIGTAAFLGLGIYFIVWLVTLVLHARLLAALRRAG